MKLLTVLWLGVGLVIGDSNPGNDDRPVCTAWCRGGPVSQDKVCNHVKVSKIDDGVCGCSSNHRLSISYSRFNATVLQAVRRKKFLKITWEQTVGLSTVLYLPGYDGDIGSCWNISTPEQMGGKRTVALRVGCTQPDKLNITDPRFKVLDLREWTVVASYTTVTQEQVIIPRNKDRGRSRSKRMTIPCGCWIADSVVLSRLGPSDLVVQWAPFCSSSDIRVRIEKYKEKTAVRDFTIRLIDLCMKGINSTIIRDLPHGKYIAKVAAIGEGCAECVTYSPSDPIPIIDPEKETTPGVYPPSQIPLKQENSMVGAAIVIVGVFAFVGVVSLGAAFCFCRRRLPSPYGPVKTDDCGMEPFLSVTVPITIGEVRKDKDATLITDLLCHELSHNHKLIQRKKFEDVGPELDDGHYLLMVTLDDVNGGNVFQRYEDCWERAILIFLDYTTSGLVVRIPGSLEQIYFHGQPNNRIRRTELVDIEEFFRRINPQLSFPNHDMEVLKMVAAQFVNQETENTRRILLISAPASNDFASLELAKLIRHLGKDVTCVTDEQHRGRQEELGHEEWACEQVRNSDMAVVVGSYKMYKLLQRFKEGTVPEKVAGAVTSLIVLNDNAEHIPIVFVSFGDQFKYIHKVMNILRGLQTVPRYDLTGSNTLNVTSALRVFLSRLSADQEVVTSACALANDFYRHVQESETQLAELDNGVDKTCSEADDLSRRMFGGLNLEEDCLWARRKSVVSSGSASTVTISSVPGGFDV